MFPKFWQVKAELGNRRTMYGTTEETQTRIKRKTMP